MAEKIITSRVKQRFDTLSEWQAIWETFKPLKGEVCKIQIPANTEVTGLRTSSSVRVMTKTGDGETTLALLPWDSAIGADETQLSKGTDQTASKSLSHGGKFTAITETSVSGHKVTDTTTTYTLPAETAVNVTATTGSALTPAHGGKVTLVTGVAKGTNSHDVKVTTQEVQWPSQTSLSKGTDSTAAATLTHGGTFTAITETTVSGHQITDTTTTYTLPAETTLSKGTDATAAKTLEFGKTFTAVTDTAVSGHKITDTTTTFTMPSETTLSKGTDSTAATTLTHGGTFTAVTDTSVSGHKITDTTTTYTLPAETVLSVDQGTASSSNPAHGGTVTVVTGVTKGDSSHNIDVAKTTITFPSETTLSKATDATAATQTLTHGGTFTALTDLTVSGHAITDKPTTFTLPSETTLSVVDNESGNAVTDVTVSGHAITLKRGKNFLTAHPDISVGTDSTSAATLAHSGTFTAVDSVTRDDNGHVTKINTKTYTLPADSDTKNTAGTTEKLATKLFLAGATSQAANPQTYSNSKVYIGTDNCLYSNGSKVLTSYTDTKNTAGSTNTDSKIYLVGATSQAANPQTYSHDTAYVGTDGHLYSNSSKVFSTSYAPEAYLQWGGKNFAGGWGPIDAAMVPNFSANRLAFFNKAYVTLEVSTDAGSTWTAVNNDTIKGGLFSTGTSFPLGNTSTTKVDKSKYMNRVTITTTNAQCYSVLNKFAIRISTNGSSGCYCTIDARTKANQDSGANTWVNFANKVDLLGWSGWNIINVSGITTHGNTTSQYSQIRFTFGVTSHPSTSDNPGMQILRIMAFGGEGWSTCSNMATDGHLYSYDGSQNATFPAGLNTTGELKENGTRVSKIGHTHSVTAAGSVGNASITPAGSVSQPTFTGTEAGHTHTFTGTAANHNHTFTGTAHDHSFTGSAVTSGGASATISINSVTSVGTAASHSYTAPSLTASCANQCLTLTWSAGSHSFTANTVPTVEAKTVATAHTHSVTAAGTVGSKTAGGTVANASVTPAGTIAETKITPAGTVSKPTFTGTTATHNHSFTGSAVTSAGSTT